MNITNYLKKSPLYNVIVAETFMSQEFRDKLSKISKYIIFILIFVLLFFYFTKDSIKFLNLKIFVDAYGLTDKAVGLILFNFGIFIYSKLAHFYLSSTYYFEKISNNKYTDAEPYTFSAGRVLYAGRKTDILHGFLKSKIGKMVFKKLGIDKKDRKTFYKSQSIMKGENVPAHDSEILKIKDIVEYLYTTKPDFAKFLNDKGITEDKLLNTIDQVVSDIETKEYNTQWWRPEALAKIKPLIKL